MEHSISSCKHLYNRIKKAQDDIETEYLYVSTMMMLNEGVSPNKKGREEIAAFQLEHFDTYLSTLKMQLEEFETAVLSIGELRMRPDFNLQLTDSRKHPVQQRGLQGRGCQHYA